MAKSRLKMLSKMEIIQKPQQEKTKPQYSDSWPQRNDVYTLKDVTFGIPEGPSFSQKGKSASYYRDGVCIIGPKWLR